MIYDQSLKSELKSNPITADKIYRQNVKTSASYDCILLN